MAEASPSFSTLPDELHLRILHFAGWRAGVNLGQTCRKFRVLCEESTFWREAAKDTFRMHLDNFNERGNWKQEFRRLITGRFYGWGQNQSLMFSPIDHDRAGMGRLARNSPWPRPLEDREYRGLVDVQSGGWCVILLTLQGSIIIAGSLDGASSWSARALRTLKFPVKGLKFYQISCGRSHLLALSAKGEVWSVRGNRPVEVPVLIQFMDVDTVLDYPGNKVLRRGAVKKVVAGWAGSGALVKGYGIAIWFDELPGARRTRIDTPSYGREVCVKDTLYLSQRFVPTSGYSYDQDPVVDFTIGEHFLIAVTASGKVFAANLSDIQDSKQVAPMQLLKLGAPKGQPAISRVEGKFQRFGVFNKNGLVHLFDDADLHRARDTMVLSPDLDAMKTDVVEPQVVEELTKYNIVDIAFGDWHYLALTDTGKVLSWGTECQGCGSLGLGPTDIATSRGVEYRPNGDSHLDVPQVVSFDYGAPPVSQGSATGWHRALTTWQTLHPYAEKSGVPDDTSEYVYKISAAGWHSCALVALVDQDSTLSAGGISQPVDGSSEPKEQDDPTQLKPHEKELRPITERGHRGGIVGMESEARGGQRGPAEGTIARGGQSIFGMGGFNRAEPDRGASLPKTERGHRGGIVGVESDAKGGGRGLAEGTIAKGGQSHFGMMGGRMELEQGDKLKDDGRV